LLLRGFWQYWERGAPLLVEVSVLSGSITFLWPASFGLFAYLDFGPCPLFLFLSLSWVLSFYKVWQGFIIWEGLKKDASIQRKKPANISLSLSLSLSLLY
jgi:hypothetical protein